MLPIGPFYSVFKTWWLASPRESKLRKGEGKGEREVEREERERERERGAIHFMTLLPYVVP